MHHVRHPHLMDFRQRRHNRLVLLARHPHPRKPLPHNRVEHLQRDILEQHVRANVVNRRAMLHFAILLRVGNEIRIFIVPLP